MAEDTIEIQWTDSARKSFDKIISYLQEEWSQKEVENFISQVSKMLYTLQRYPEMCRPSTKRKYTRIGILNKHNPNNLPLQTRKQTNRNSTLLEYETKSINIEILTAF